MSHPLIDEPNFIEASAGTGKTYRIMMMLEKIMREDTKNQYAQNRLLKTIILTFTEKAAGELKTRLKQKILELYNEGANPEFYTYLRDLDQVQIATIHGFCNLILNEYAIETGTIGKTKLVNINEITKQNLYYLKRNGFGIRDENLLATLLEKSDFLKKEVSVLKTAYRILADTKDYLIPNESNESQVEFHADSDADEFLQYITLKLVDLTKKSLIESDSITYDQMILKLKEAVTQSPEFVKTLQNRYEICILDEFQDTDKNQFEIFKTIFGLDQNLGQRLFCIGDPKQSIYSFRGADIGIYLGAKDILKSKKDNKGEDNLDINFRSAKELIDGYNQIFYDDSNAGKTNFFPISEPGYDSSHYKYNKVKPPPPDQIKFSLLHDQGKAIQIINFDSTFQKIDEVRHVWIKYIVSEIQSLVQPNKEMKYEFRPKNSLNFEVQKLRLKDIAILCDKNNDAVSIERDLSKQGIPCSIYKRKGIYQSLEAEQINNLLECLSSPNKPESYRKILFSEIFGIAAEELSKFNEYTIESYEKRLIDKWVKLTNQHKFAECFRSILEETKLYWNFEGTKLEWERKRTNYKQIFQKLLEFQIKGNYNLTELIAELNKWKEEKTSEEEQPLYDRETEEDAVQILTIHSAKGLEWPVVFLYYFGSRGNTQKDYDYPEEILEGKYKVRKWILELWEGKSKLKPKEKDIKTGMERNHFWNESRRLLYVALTRPNVRLYLPHVSWALGTRSAHFFHNSGYGAILYPELERISKNPDLNCFEIKNVNVSELLSQTKQEENNSNVLYATPQGNTIFFDFTQAKGKILVQHSYSALKSFSQHHKKLLVEKDIEEILEEDKGPAKEENDGLLPSNSQVGNLLHRILELVEYQIFKENEETILNHPSWTFSYKSAFRDYPVYLQKDDSLILPKLLISVLKKAMTATISLQKSTISLADLPKEIRSNELKFNLFLEPHLKKLKPKQNNTKQILENYLKGAIDLVFESDGLYYIADFKSDRMKDKNYEKTNLAKEIEERGYSLQKDLYAFVLFEYLSSIYTTKVALTKFGGVLYFFLRGMEGNNGVYADLGEKEPWTETRFESIKANLLQMILDSNLRWENEI